MGMVGGRLISPTGDEDIKQEIIMGYRVVVDLEMCGVPRENRTESFHWADETIQIGAVLLDENLDIVDNFNTYVCPELGTLTDRIKELTGIQQDNLYKAPFAEDAIKMFTEWIPEGDVEIVSWSETDKRQFEHELEGKGIENSKMEELLGNWTDCQATFAEKMNTKRKFRLSDALIMADIETEGQAHDGYYDAYNTALLYAKMERDEDINTNKYFIEAHDENVEHLSCSMGDLFSKFKLQLAG